MSTPVLRYAPWQLRDHLRGSGLLIAMATVILGVIMWRVRLANPGVSGAGAAPMTGLLGAIGWPLVLLTTSGIISADRVEGYNRAIFSAPVSPVRYYFQRWLIGGAVVATLPSAMAVATRLALGEWVDPWPFTAVLLLLYLLLGALVFCWSSFGRRDWVIGLALYTGQSAIRGAKEAELPLPKLMYTLNEYLPPFHLIDFGSPVRPGVELPTGAEWIHFVGYALALLAIGLAVLAWRPMGSGVRG